MGIVLRDAWAALFLTFVYLSAFAMVLPGGVNKTFATRAWPLIGALAFAVLAAAVAHSWWKNERVFQFVQFEKWRREDLFLLLLPMAPIAQYVIQNQETLSLYDSARVLSVFLALSVGLVLVVPSVLGVFARRYQLMLTAAILTCILFAMPLLSAQLHWHRDGSLKVQLIALFLLLGIFYVISTLQKRALHTLITIYFVSSVAGSVLALDFSASGTALGSPLQEVTRGKSMQNTPDIFLLTYDSYVGNETLVQYGLDNADHEAYLRRHKFEIYDGRYSVGAYTSVSMNNLLHVPEELDQAIPVAAAGGGTVQNVLRQNGYETIGVFPTNYFFLMGEPAYDQNYPLRSDFGEVEPSAYANITRAILSGVFRYHDTFASVPTEDYLAKKLQVLGSAGTGKPKFLYTHSGPGHSQNSGQCLADETSLFGERLAAANEEMKTDIQTILEANPGALIIVNGDHGPYLTQNCLKMEPSEYSESDVSRLDIQDRYGTFVAIRWPEGAVVEHDQLEILQDVFPVVFAYLFDDRALVNSRARRPVSLVGPHRTIAGVDVTDGIIMGGVNDGEPLFESMREEAPTSTE